MSAGKDDFLEELARLYLVEWCQQTIAAGVVLDVTASAKTDAEKACSKLCFQHAVVKGWVSAAKAEGDPQRVLARGFSVAAAYLRR